MDVARSKRTSLLKLILAAGAAMLAAWVLAFVATEKPAKATFAGENGKFTFHSAATTGEGVENPEGDYEIFTMNPDGTDLAQLTHNTTDDISPEWSATGERIAFSGFDGNDYEIFTVPAGSGQPTRVTDNVEDDFYPTWSPDGSTIAYAGDDPNYTDRDIYKIEASGGGTPILVRDSNRDVEFYSAGKLDWSPDGSKITFRQIADEGFTGIGLVTADGEPLSDPNASSFFQEDDPEWSPDGSKIVFWAYVDQDQTIREIYTVTAERAPATPLTDDATSYEAAPVWSPDGSKIAFLARGTSGDGIYAVPAGGGEPTKISDIPEGGMGPLDWGVAAETTNTAPTITSLRPAPGSSTTDRTPIIAATVADQQTDLAKSNITLLLDDETIPRSAYSYNRSTDRMRYTPEKKLPFGKHAVKVIAEDGSGLSTTKRWSFTIVQP